MISARYSIMTCCVGLQGTEQLQRQFYVVSIAGVRFARRDCRRTTTDSRIGLYSTL